MTDRRFYARSASDNRDDWPFWYVADSQKGGLNVTADLIRKHINPNHAGGVFMEDWKAVQLAGVANGSS